MLFVHGVGPPRRVDDELRQWLTALADGARSAGHSAFSDDLLRGKVRTSFAHYGDLFLPAQAQGSGFELDEDEANLLTALLTELIDEHLAVTDDLERRQVLENARSQLVAVGAEQGILAPIRRAINAVTTLLAYRPLSRSGQWLGGKLLVGALAQVVRYLARGEQDERGQTLDVRVRQRVHDHLSERSIVIAHSLGSVVGWETLHEHQGEVPLLVTLGSPLAMRSVVLPRLAPQPPATPPSVHKWINLWDRDDIIVARAKLENDMRPNHLGVIPESSRIDSDGLWVHTATKYLRKPDLAGPVAEAVMA